MNDLLELIKQKSYRRGSFTLASGTSDYFFDLKPTILDPQGANLIADQVLAITHAVKADAVGGLAMEAIPLVAAAVVRSHGTATPLQGFYVHGTQIDGLDVNGLEVVLVEAVTTTGGSLLKAANAVRDAGGWVSYAITVVDRLEGGAEMLGEHYISLIPILTRREFT
jgi:orotate phosphoribosyltransferase